MTLEEKKALLVGAMAGAMPTLANLVSLEAHLIFDGFSYDVFAGYMIKLVGLMALGAFLVFVNKERELSKAFQLGVMAPAIVIGTLNANNLETANKTIGALEEQLRDKNKSAKIVPEGVGYLPVQYAKTPTKPRFSLFAYAHANELQGVHNKPSSLQRFWYGVTGDMQDSWFVIVGSHSSENNAKKQADELRKAGFDARVYPPFGNSQYYGVVISSYVPLQKAKEVKADALQAGLPEDTYLWKWRH